MTPDQITNFKKAFPQAVENEPMAKHTNIRIGGPVKLFLRAQTPDVLVVALEISQELGISFHVFGGGSNLLVSDQGYDGLIIQCAFREIKLRNKTITAEAGAITSVVARQTAEAGLEGFEWAVGVPGTIGGAIYGNSGCYGGETKDNLVTVDCIRLSDMKRMVYTKADCKFGYRDSRFKAEPHVILRATFCLIPAEAESLTKRMEDITQSRKEKQPMENSSAGCMFKNFVFKDESKIQKLKDMVKDIPAKMLERKSISAGWLVSQAGLLGERVGDAQVSEKHGNFLVNVGQARAQDILMLTSKVKMKIRDEYNIMLEDEVQLVGF